LVISIAVREEGGRHLLQPQPGRAERSRHDVEEHRQREHGDADPAQDHEQRLEPVEGAPLELAMALQDQGAEVGHSLSWGRSTAALRVPRPASSAHAPSSAA
jgi:hypothetical protein